MGDFNRAQEAQPVYAVKGIDYVCVCVCVCVTQIIHDYEHRGVNNDYLIRMSDSLAVLYNDRSPMENHHLAAAFQLINTPEYNFMPKVCVCVYVCSALSTSLGVRTFVCHPAGACNE